MVAASALGQEAADLAETEIERATAPQAATARPTYRRRTAGRTRRVPLPLPPAVLDDSVEAAGYLVRLPEVVLLVDGYNVSLQTWPGVELPEQRHRLVSAVAELVMRTGVSAMVAWDGSDQEAFPAPTGVARSAVRVVFSTPGEDADEVIIDQVDRLPPDRPVVVATDDRRVQTEVRRRGANVISTAQLLGVLKRGPVGS
jgi:predicted RNA-binding protein with PIN domain